MAQVAQDHGGTKAEAALAVRTVSRQREVHLPQHPTDDLLKEKLESELRVWVAEFNGNENAHPSKRIHAIQQIRECREKLRRLR